MEAHDTSICWEYQAEVEEPWTAFRHSEQVQIQEARRRGSDELHLKSLQLLLFFSSMTAIGANDELKLRERRRSEQKEAQYISKLVVEAEVRSERQKRWFDGTRIYMNEVTTDEEDEQPKPSAVDLSEDETHGSTSTELNEVSIVHDLLELRDLQYVLASTYSSAVGYLYEHLPPEVEVTPILGMISSPGTGSGYKTKARLYDLQDGHPPAFCPSVAKWGVFHAKLLLLSSPTKLRVVISSANISSAQFSKQSQNLWVCDFAVKAAGARTGTFARGLEQFVSSMLSVDHRHVDGGEKGAAGEGEVMAWADRAKERWLGELRRFDLSPPPNVHLVASNPFSPDHGGVKRLASILDSSTLPLYDCVAYQHTSFGKLDKTFLAGLKAALGARDGERELEVVWPAYSSALTRRGKGNLCLSEVAFARIKELRLDQQFCELVASTPSHSGTLSHGKVIVGYKREDLSRLAFVYCGSHNMSIAAWGCVNRKPNSFELGVLMIAPGLNHVSLPFQLPPPSYPPGEEPYILPVYYRKAFGRTDEDVREELEAAAALYDKLAVADQPRPRAIIRSLNSLAAQSTGPRLLLILSGSTEDHDRDQKVVSLLCDAELTQMVDGALGGVVVCVGSRRDEGRVVTYGQHLCSFTHALQDAGTWQLVEEWSKWDDVGELSLKSSSHLSNKLAAHLAGLAASEAQGHGILHAAAAGQQLEALQLKMATSASTAHANVLGGSCCDGFTARCRSYAGEEGMADGDVGRAMAASKETFEEEDSQRRAWAAAVARGGGVRPRGEAAVGVKRPRGADDGDVCEVVVVGDSDEDI